MKYQVKTAAMYLHPGTLIQLDKDQISTRSHALDIEDPAKGWCLVSSTVCFKSGEIIGLKEKPDELDSALEFHLSPVAAVKPAKKSKSEQSPEPDLDALEDAMDAADEKLKSAMEQHGIIDLAAMTDEQSKAISEYVSAAEAAKKAFEAAVGAE